MSTSDQVFSDYQKSAATDTAKPLTAALSRRKTNFEHVAPKDPHFRVHVPIDFSPDALGDDDGTIGQAKGRAALQQLWDVHTKLNATALTVQNKADLAKQTEPIVLKAIKSMKEEIAGLDRQNAHAIKELATSLGNGIGMLQAELRSICRDKPQGERVAFVREVLASGDLDAIKALAAVSPVLSGLDAETYNWFREQAERLINPKAFAERAASAAARDRCARALDDFDMNMAGNIRRWRDSDHQKIADLVSSLTPKKEGE